MFVNRMPRYEILSEDAIEVLDRGWRRNVSEIGIEFTLDEAAEEFRRAGQTVEGSLVRLDPDFVLEGSVRRDATMADFENFVRLSQAFEELDSPGGTIVEPSDRPLDSRHLDMVLALQTLSDKPYMGSVTSGPNAADTIQMGEILFGGRDALESTTASLSIINVNSPLRYDERMLSAWLEYARARQAAMSTPFLLMGAMSPVAIPATLAQQLAEALSGIALAQLVRPGTPVVMGSFLSNTDMQSGSPSFGTPESGIGLLCSGHTLERFRECFYRPLLSSTENFDRWRRNGGRDATERAGEIWRRTLEEHQPPPIDAAAR